MRPHLPVSTRRSPSVAIDGRPLRLAVYGAGKAAKFHLDALRHVAGWELAGVCSRSGSSGDALVEGHPGAVSTTDPAALADPSQVDAAIVAVAHEASADQARRLLDAGIPVLAEKPAALTSSEVDELATLAADRGVVAAVAVNRRYYSLVQQAIAVVRQRGPVRGVLVEGHEPVDQLLRQGDIDADQALRWLLLNSVHYIDLLRVIGGDVEAVHAVGRADGVATGDHFSATIEHRGGGLGTYIAHWNSTAPPMVRIYGDEVSAEVRLVAPEEGFASFPGKRRIKLSTDWADDIAKPGVLEQDVAFLSAVATGSTVVAPPASSLADHVETLRLVEAFAASVS